MELPRKRWETAQGDAAAARRVADGLGLPFALAAALGSRGCRTCSDAETFLHPRLSDLNDPFRLPDMERAVDRVFRALRDGESIAVYGDYDADGLTAAALTVSVLRAMGGRAEAFVPSRFTDGYGLTANALRRCVERLRPSLVVTVDCGTEAAEPVRNAGAAGIDVVVTDHHEISDKPAEAAAVVNPELGSETADRDLAGVGVAFKLCHGLVARARRVVTLVDGRVDRDETQDAA